MKDICYVGIDPGLDGAIARIWPDGDLHVLDTPTLMVGKKRQLDYARASRWLDPLPHHPYFVCLEKVHSMPKQGVASSFNFGVGFGIWLGIIGALRLRHELVTPQRWKKLMMDGMPKEKDASRQRAQQLFPEAELHLKKHHGRADALLLAEYLRRTDGGGV